MSNPSKAPNDVEVALRVDQFAVRFVDEPQDVQRFAEAVAEAGTTVGTPIRRLQWVDESGAVVAVSAELSTAAGANGMAALSALHARVEQAVWSVKAEAVQRAWQD